MQIAIINGIYATDNSDFRTSYPRNLQPVPKSHGISSGYLRPAEGIDLFATTSGVDRGGINWNGTHYRVVGTSLVSISNVGVVTTIGTITGSDLVAMDYSFDHLGIVGDGKFYLYDGTTLTQVVDPDILILPVIDVVWVDGYFMLTDGEFIIVTELNDPFQVNPLKYGSSEVDPDPITGLVKVRNEVHALNRHTIEAFYNTGGELFPFQRIDGAQVTAGNLSPTTCCVVSDNLIFLGGGRGEAISLWSSGNGQKLKISTHEIDKILSSYPLSVLSQCVVERRLHNHHQMVYIHLPDKTLVYDLAATQELGSPIWFTLDSGLNTESRYRARNFVRCHDAWYAGDPTGNRIGRMVDTHAAHYGVNVGWEFNTIIVYNEGQGAIFHEMELVHLTGGPQLGEGSVVTTSYSVDGVNFSPSIGIVLSPGGYRSKRLVWFKQGWMRNWRIQRFQGDSSAMMSVARLQAKIEPLMV